MCQKCEDAHKKWEEIRDSSIREHNKIWAERFEPTVRKASDEYMQIARECGIASRKGEKK